MIVASVSNFLWQASWRQKYSWLARPGILFLLKRVGIEDKYLNSVGGQASKVEG